MTFATTGAIRPPSRSMCPAASTPRSVSGDSRRCSTLRAARGFSRTKAIRNALSGSCWAAPPGRSAWRRPPTRRSRKAPPRPRPSCPRNRGRRTPPPSRPDGPYYVRGNLEIEETPGAEVVQDTRVAFCRCGHSENKPLCDQSHERVGFRCEAAVTPGPEPVPPVADEAAPVRFTPFPNGPLGFRGPLTISGRGGARVTLDQGKLCRCGHSKNRPLCDGSHREAGFRAP